MWPERPAGERQQQRSHSRRPPTRRPPIPRRRRRRDGKSVPGPRRVTPFLGGLVEMVMDPYAFWEKQRRYSPLGFSYNSLFGKHILFVTDAEKCRELMSVNDPEKMLMVLHPSAKNILGHDNMAFIHGPEHKLLRKSFLSLFTRKALSTYVELQVRRGGGGRGRGWSGAAVGCDMGAGGAWLRRRPLLPGGPELPLFLCIPAGSRERGYLFAGALRQA